MDANQRELSDIEAVIRRFIKHEDAVRLLLDIWIVIQAWDDAYDGDPNPDMEGAFRRAMIDLPNNPLYLQCSIPFQINQIYFDWCAANKFEEAKLEYEKAYMLRASYYRIIVMMIAFTEGHASAADKSADVWLCYGETFKEYKEDQCQDR